MHKGHRMDFDIARDNELKPCKPYTIIRDHGKCKSAFRVSKVHHNLGSGAFQVFQADGLFVERKKACVYKPVFSFSTAHSYFSACFKYFGGIFSPDNRRDSKFPTDYSCMAGPSSLVCNNRSCGFHNRFPVRSGCIRNQDLTGPERGKVRNVRNYTGFSGSDLVSNAPTFCKDFGLLFKDIGLQHILCPLGLDGFGSCLQYEDFSCYAVFCPFDVHGPGFSVLIRIMVFDIYCISGKFEHLFVINTEALPVSLRYLHVPREDLGVSPAVNHLDFFASHLLLDDRLIPFPKSGLEYIELIRVDLPLHNILSKTICPCNENNISETCFRIESKNNSA